MSEQVCVTREPSGHELVADLIKHRKHEPGHVVYLQKDKVPGRTGYEARICKRCGVVYVPEKE